MIIPLYEQAMAVHCETILVILGDNENFQKVILAGDA